MEPVAMEAGKILHELTYAEGLPKEALKAATAHREEMLPLFIEEIETFLALEPTGGSSQKFCCTGHRQQFWIAARRWTMRAIDAGLLSVACLKRATRACTLPETAF